MTVVRQEGRYERRVYTWVVSGSKSNDKPLILHRHDIVLSDDGYELVYLRYRGSEGKPIE